MRVRIPRYIDDPPQIFWWEVDEAAAFSGAFVLGAVCGYVAVGLAVGFAFAWILGRLKEGKGGRFLICLAYWYGLSPVRPESFRRRFFE